LGGCVVGWVFLKVHGTDPISKGKWKGKKKGGFNRGQWRGEKKTDRALETRLNYCLRRRVLS